jgi:hypothetical protein
MNNLACVSWCTHAQFSKNGCTSVSTPVSSTVNYPASLRTWVSVLFSADAWWLSSTLLQFSLPSPWLLMMVEICLMLVLAIETSYLFIYLFIYFKVP